MLPDFQLQGRRALVTGGSRGIGLAIARAYAAAGAQVVLLSRHEAGLREAAAQIEAPAGAVAIEAMDLAEVEHIEARYAALLERHGPIDILVNGAATSGRGRVLDMPVADFHQVLALDLSSVFALSQAFARACIARGVPGRIVNIASLASFTAVRTPSVAYASAKGELLLLTRQMAFELAPHNILVNAIPPGYVETEMTSAFRGNAANEAWRQARVPMQRWGAPHEIAGPALLLASAAGSFMTGSVITIDGGLTAVL